MDELNLKTVILDKIKRNDEPSEDEQLLEDIRTICKKMEAAYTRFEFEKDEDLVDAAIYEIEALKSRYRHLLKTAKKGTCKALCALQALKNSGGLRIWGRT